MTEIPAYVAACLFAADGALLEATPAGRALAARLDRPSRARIAALASRVNEAGFEPVTLPVRAAGATFEAQCRAAAGGAQERALLLMVREALPRTWGPAVLGMGAGANFRATAPLVARASPDPLQALRHAAGGRPTLRFVWHCDANGVVLSVSAALTRILPADGLPVGRRWGDLYEYIDAAAELDAHAVSGRAWSGLVVHWRLGDGVSAPVEFGAAPVRDRAGGHAGQRGYGLIRLDEAVAQQPETEGGAAIAAGARPRAADAWPAGPAREAETTVAPGSRPVRERAIAAPVAPSLAAVSRGDAGEEAIPSVALAGDPAHAAGPASVKGAGSGPGGAKRPALSRGDRQTLRDIARALGVTVAEAPPPTAPGQAGDDREREAAAPAEHAGAALAPAARETGAPGARTLRDLVNEIAGAREEPEPGGGREAGRDPAPVQEEMPEAFQPEPPPAGPAPPAGLAPELPLAGGLGHAGDGAAPAPEEAVAPEAVAPAAPASCQQQQVRAAALPPPPAALDLPATRERADVVRRLAQSAPVAMLVSRGEEILHANQDFVALSRYAGVAELVRSGLRGLFPETAPARGFHGRASLQGARGVRMPVLLVCIGAPWEGEEALLTLAMRDPSAEAEARARHLETELAALGAREAELRAILDTATDGVLLLDGQGRLLSVNRSAEALFGYEQNELVGEPLTRLLDGASHQTALDYLALMRAGGPASLLNDGREIVGRVRQGGECHLFMTLGRAPSAAGDRFCAVLRDVTAWKKTENDLIESRRRAEAANAQKSDFLARMSHEVRTPLGAMIGFAELMLEERLGPIANPRYREYVRDIHESGQYVISLVNDLLDLARIEAGRMELNFASLDLNAVLASCVTLMQPQAAKARIVLRSSLDEALPPVVADERSMRQIALNIIGNALKFTDAGGQVIVSSLRNEAGEVMLRIRDTGIGMRPDEVEEALKPFRRLAPGRNAPGTGLGLPLTAALAEANRGRLQVSSTPGEGTMVEVVLPTARVLSG